ncbi:MAG: 4-hydroxy-3-methylbut-2-enyl diphosphate reductase [candidate division WOR-3 bacterium]|nr:4-hydroxy-3-methylbut-2-enyl diphosphate reductase [candidate division WOR-3 bacterium]MDW8151129.1 4-hydroxy-3-methylbut-2-enyl diphosphate reductase [candidate division WOR-3 bacterium]
MNSFKIYLARPRGFCAGVDRAIEVVRLTLKKYGRPIYVKHAIVHNKFVVRELEKEGAVFVEDINEIPDNSIVVFSAHGSPPIHYEIAKKKGLKVIDATCPLVHKVHREAKEFVENGYFIIYIGHKNHVEAIGIKGECEDKIDIIETKEEAMNYIPKSNKLALLTQTTLSVDDTREIIEILKRRFPQIVIPKKEDICYATQNRQDAIKKISKICDLVLVIGSNESSNSNRLREVAEKHGAKSYLIESYEYINDEWLKDIKNIGITSGASTPEILVQKTIDYLLQKGGEEVIELGDAIERIRFQLPQI